MSPVDVPGGTAPVSPGTAPEPGAALLVAPAVPSAALEPASGVDMSVGEAIAPSPAGTVSVSLRVVPSPGELQAASRNIAGMRVR